MDKKATIVLSLGSRPMAYPEFFRGGGHLLYTITIYYLGGAGLPPPRYVYGRDIPALILQDKHLLSIRNAWLGLEVFQISQ